MIEYRDLRCGDTVVPSPPTALIGEDPMTKMVPFEYSALLLEIGCWPRRLVRWVLVRSDSESEFHDAADSVGQYMVSGRGQVPAVPSGPGTSAPLRE